MSQENVEPIGEMIEAVARQDVARLVELTDPDIEWRSFLAELGDVYRGHAGIKQYARP